MMHLLTAKNDKEYRKDFCDGIRKVFYPMEQREVKMHMNQDIKKDWTPILPIPKGIEFPDLENHGYLKYMFDEYDYEDKYAYTNEKNEILGYVIRLNKKDKTSKKLPTLTYCKNISGNCNWYWRGFQDKSYIYNVYELLNNLNKEVLIVEGEKTANAAKQKFPNYVVITFYGGVNAYDRVDWSPLKGRTITIWPDADQAGMDAVNGIIKSLTKYGIEMVSTLHHNFSYVNLPKGWDLADEFPEGMDLSTALTWLKRTKTIYVNNTKDSHLENRDPTL
jgi:5S rRNA maturation endonuclease (ribonuclease M5)